MASKPSSSHQGTVKDSEHDGRLKENREAGRTMGTTDGTRARAAEHGQEPAPSSRATHESGREDHGSSHPGGSHGSSNAGSGNTKADDMKAGDTKADNTKAGTSASQSEQDSHQGRERPVGQSGKAGEDAADLKSREYTDEQGNVHHHTRVHQEQHKGK